MSDYPMLISNKLHSFRNFTLQKYGIICCTAFTIVQKICAYCLGDGLL